MEYFNPQAVNPGTAFKPDGFLGGYIWGEDRNRYNQLAPLQDFMQMIQAQESQNKMQEYGLNEQLRAAERAGKIASARATESTVGRQKEAEVGKLEVDNEYSRLSLKDRVKKVFLDNAKLEPEIAEKNMEQAAYLASLYAAAGKQGPLAVQQVDELARKLNMGNDPIVQAFRSNPQIAGVIGQAAVEARADYRQAMDKQRLQGQQQMDVAREHSRSAMAVANARAQQKNKGYEQLLREAKKDEDVLRLWQIMSSDPEVAPSLLAKAKAAAEQADRNLKARGAERMQPPLAPGLPSQTPQSRLPGQTDMIPSPGIIDFNQLK